MPHTVSSLLTDLYRHQEWADAELWRAVAACPATTTDKALLERWHHIHLVQRAFLSIVTRRAVELTKPDEFKDAGALRNYGRAYHTEAIPLVQALTPDRLDEMLTLPWFKDPPIHVSVSEALLQAVMHSQHHRGQNATRLRELGGEPPMTDYIGWLWKGRPAPAW